jgi:hypothetical protein
VRTTAAALVALACAACSYDVPLERVAFHVRAGGVARDASQPLTVTTPQGWTVTLTAAQVSIGPIYLHNGQAGVGTDQDDGRVVAQVLAQFTVDALSPALGPVDGAAEGITEPARTAEVRLVEASAGPVADAAGADVAVAHVAGVARRGGVEIPFDGSLRLPMGATVSGYQTTLQHRVSHVPAAFTPAEGGTLTLRVDPTHWLDGVPFDAGGAAFDFGTRSATTQLLGGVGASSGVFVFVWEPPRS